MAELASIQTMLDHICLPLRQGTRSPATNASISSMNLGSWIIVWWRSCAGLFVGLEALYEEQPTLESRFLLELKRTSSWPSTKSNIKHQDQVSGDVS
jgi:hypothetical protein